MLVRLLVFSVLVAVTVAQLSKSEQIGCFAKASNIAQGEKDKELKKMMTKTLETITDMAMDLMTEMSDAQKDKVLKSYFTGKCTQLTILSLFEKTS